MLQAETRAVHILAHMARLLRSYECDVIHEKRFLWKTRLGRVIGAI